MWQYCIGKLWFCINIKYLFVSEEIGVGKPDIRYFEVVFDAMGITDKSKVLIVGDSLASDIVGGITAGIDTCWYSPENKTTKLTPTYIVDSLDKVFEIALAERSF